MTDADAEALDAVARARVRVECDEYHQHSAERGCLAGDPRDLAILRLCEALRIERRAAAEYARACAVRAEPALAALAALDAATGAK